ncbi:MAG: DUF4856 domain-containing protein [Polaribacter sp.]|uniref:DUF4856 domain-containing protein n=1 Tax=Polaribacter sp. TaxID=1920175 RepID=UPI0038515B20
MKFQFNTIKLITLSLFLATAFSCSNDDEPLPIVIEEEEEQVEVIAPATYSFERGGATTVSYGGQSARLNMAASLFSKLNDENVSAATLLEMFNEGKGFTAEDGADAEEQAAIAALNASGKKLGNKTAAYGNASVQPKIAGFLTEYAEDVSTNFNTNAEAGVAGSHTGAGGRTVRINGKGMELNQVFAKSLIGALVMDQVAYGYLSAKKIGDDVDNDATGLGAGEYTTMEHHWDEGLGYVYGQEDDIETAATPQGNGVLFNKYLKKVSADGKEEPGLGAIIYDAFKLGRAAIVAGDATVKNEQAEIVKTKMSRVILHKAAYYLRGAATAREASSVDYADFFHGLSEGYGFVLSLQFTYDASGASYFSHEEVTTMLTSLEAGNGFWDITPSELNAMAAQIEAKI